MKQFFKYVLVALLGMAMLSCSREDGADGINGKTILSGRGRPYASLGVVGDFYIDLNTYNLYGPKTSQGWNNPISLIGADGKDGQDGKDGVDGRDGNDGRNGADGHDGRDGKDGQDAPRIWTGEVYPTSDIGNDGDFYLDLKNKVLYGPKTNGSWGVGIPLGGDIRNVRADFLLSADGRILLKWLNPYTTSIDMEADPDLRNVTTISENAFDEAGGRIREITLPNGLVSIEDKVFDKSKLSYLRSVIMRSNNPPSINFDKVFPGWNGIFIYVPAGSITDYVLAGWKRSFLVEIR